MASVRLFLPLVSAAQYRRDRNISAASDEFGDHARDDLVERLPVIGSLHVGKHGVADVPNPRNSFTFAGKDNAGRT